MAPRHTRGSGHDFDDSLGTDRGHLRGRVAVTVNAELTMLYWGIGRRVREDVLGSEKPEYGRVVVERLAERLTARFGRGYSWSSLFRMMRFAAIYESREILAPLVPILTWSHFLQLIALSDADERARRRAADRPDPVHEQGPQQTALLGLDHGEIRAARYITESLRDEMQRRLAATAGQLGAGEG